MLIVNISYHSGYQEYFCSKRSTLETMNNIMYCIPFAEYNFMITHLVAPDVPVEAIFPEMHVRWKRRGYNQIKTNYVRNTIRTFVQMFLTNDQHSSTRQQETLKILH